MSIDDKMTDMIQDFLPEWTVTYNSDNEKILVSTHTAERITPEALELIRQMGLSVFSIEKVGKIVLVEFSTGGGC